MKDKLLTLLKITISLGLIAYVFSQPMIREANWRAMLANVRVWPWLVAMVIYFVAIGLNVLKWQYLLATLGVRVPYLSLFRHNLVGLFFANLPLSMVGGDIARGWDLARHIEGQAAVVAVSVLVDRLVGLAAFLFCAVVGLAYAVYGLDQHDLTWLLATIAALLIVFAAAFAVLMSQRLRRLVERLLMIGPLARLLPLYRKLSDAVQGYRTRFDALVIVFGFGLLTVAATCIVNYLAAVTIGANVPLVWVFILTPLTPFALYIPSIASGLGVNQAVFVALYHNLTGLLPQAPALAMSLVMQITIYVASLPGAVLWWRRREAPPAPGGVPGAVE
ncbi:MAG: flippase-like domain-containing protein [Anaerolineae bacterium]|nr:flippase-like domain-containing protein [Anaerolineae bacterium]